MEGIRICIVIFILWCVLLDETLSMDSSHLPNALLRFLERNQKLNFADEEDYVDELLHGHHVKDTGKHQRQIGCMCVAHFIDPHCGSDNNDYDNGCFFLCAQERDPDLRLKRWGTCQDY